MDLRTRIISRDFPPFRYLRDKPNADLQIKRIEEWVDDETALAFYGSEMQNAELAARHFHDARDAVGFEKVCKAIESFEETEHGVRYIAIRKAQANARAWESARKAGVSARHEGREFSNYETPTPGQKKAKDCVEAMAGNLKSSAMIVLYGPPGTGKTHLGVASMIARVRLSSGASPMGADGKYHKAAIMCTPVDISRRVRATYDDEATETESKVIEDFATCGLLVVDEIGAGSGSDHEKQMLCDVLCKRYENRLPSLMISNLGTEDIRKALGERVIDRIYEDAGSAFVPMAWPSYRPEARRQATV